MATKPTAARVMSGTQGMVYWNGDIVFEASSAESKIKTSREDITFAGDMWTDSKLMGVSGEFSIKVRKIYSRAKALAEAFKKGLDPRSELVYKLDDPDAFGAERVALHNCWFNDLDLISFENGKTAEDEFSGGFTDFDYLDSVEVR